MHYRLFLGFVLALLAFARAEAGPGDGSGNRAPWFAASVGRTPAADASGGTALEAEETQVSTGMGLAAGDTLSLEIGIDYQYTRYEYAGIDSRDRDLHRLQFPLHFAADMGEWQLKGYVAPGVSTSSNVMKDVFSEATSDDLIVTGRVLVERTRGETDWIAGVAHDRRFGRSRTYPIVGVLLEPRDNMHVRLAFPDPSVTVNVSDRQAVQARLYPAGHQWHVVSNDFSSDFDYRVESWRGQLNWRLTLWRALALDLSTGYEFGREHRFTSDSGTRLAIDIEDQWFFAVGLSLGPARLPAVHGAGL